MEGNGFKQIGCKIKLKKFMSNTASSADTFHAGMQIVTFPGSDFSALSYLVFLERTFLHTGFASTQYSRRILPQNLRPLGDFTWSLLPTLIIPSL